MPSEVVGASIPVEMVPVWDRAVEMHGGPSGFVQWVLTVLATTEKEGMEERTATLHAAALRSRVAYLRCQIELEQAEIASLAARIVDVPQVVRAGLSPEEWWEDALSRVGRDVMFDAGEKQTRALAERTGADPDLCVAWAASKRREMLFSSLTRNAHE